MGDISRNYSRSEFACQCGCGFDVVDAGLLTACEMVRTYFGKPVTVNSGCRCEAHNKAVGGAPNSEHRLGKAADIAVKDTPADKVADYLESEFPNSHGIGRYNGRTHVDSRRKKARWDMRG